MFPDRWPRLRSVRECVVITSRRDARRQGPPMDFPLTGLMDEDACYARLVVVLHPEGLACPRCGGDRLGVHRAHRAPILDYRCRDCRRVFNAFTGTALHKTRRPPSALILILRGFAQGATTARLARETGCDRVKLLGLRHKLHEHARAGVDPAPLPDAVVEADECYVNAGEKRGAASRAGRPAPGPGQQATRARDVCQ